MPFEESEVRDLVLFVWELDKYESNNGVSFAFKKSSEFETEGPSFELQFGWSYQPGEVTFFLRRADDAQSFADSIYFTQARIRYEPSSGSVHYAVSFLLADRTAFAAVQNKQSLPEVEPPESGERANLSFPEFTELLEQLKFKLYKQDFKQAEKLHSPLEQELALGRASGILIRLLVQDQGFKAGRRVYGAGELFRTEVVTEKFDKLSLLSSPAPFAVTVPLGIRIFHLHGNKKVRLSLDYAGETDAEFGFIEFDFERITVRQLPSLLGSFVTPFVESHGDFEEGPSWSDDDLTESTYDFSPLLLVQLTRQFLAGFREELRLAMQFYSRQFPQDLLRNFRFFLPEEEEEEDESSSSKRLKRSGCRICKRAVATLSCSACALQTCEDWICTTVSAVILGH